MVPQIDRSSRFDALQTVSRLQTTPSPPLPSLPSHQDIAGDNWLLPPHAIHAAEEKVVLRSLVLGVNHDNAPKLGQGLHLQHAWRGNKRDVVRC